MRVRIIRAAVLVSIVAGLMAVTPIASAQPPTNDDFATPTEVVEPLPYQDSIVTTEATGAPTDPGCFSEPGDPGNPTVWYSYTPSTDVFVQADTFGSNYDTTLSAYVDEGGELAQIDCNDDTFSLQSAVVLDIAAGETIFFMVGTFGGFPFEEGQVGELVFNVGPPPPPVEIELAVDPVGRVTPRDGVATVTGTVTCSEPALVEMFGQLRQRSGRFFVDGFGFDGFECDGETPFSLTIPGANGLFSAGRAEAIIEAGAFGPGGFAFDFFEGTIRLRGARP